MNGVWTRPILLKKVNQIRNNDMFKGETIRRMVLSFSSEKGDDLMIKAMKTFFLYPLLTLLQFSGIILAIVLENLSAEKMGVARYLIFKKQQFESTYFTPQLILIYTIILGIGAIICTLLLLTKGKSRGKIIMLLVAVAANIIGIIFIQFSADLMAYHFFIIGMVIVIVVQYVWIMKFFKQESKST